MKKLILIAAVLIAATNIVNAQSKIKGDGILKTITRDVKTYDEVRLIGALDVELISGKEGKLTLKGDSNLVDLIETSVQNNELIIKMKSNTNYSTRKKLVVIVPVEQISKVSLKGSGDIYSDYTMSDNHLNIDLNGSGDIVLNINNTETNVNVTGSGDVVLKGNTQTLNATLSGSGDIQAKNFKAQNGFLNLKGSGDIGVNTTKSLDANVLGSGTIQVTGNPKNITKNIKGSGDITIS